MVQVVQLAVDIRCGMIIIECVRASDCGEEFTR